MVNIKNYSIGFYKNKCILFISLKKLTIFSFFSFNSFFYTYFFQWKFRKLCKKHIIIAAITFFFLSPFFRLLFFFKERERESLFLSLVTKKRKCEICPLSIFLFSFMHEPPLFLRFNYPKFEVNIGFQLDGNISGLKKFY